jgi:hypothetical protein
MDQGPEPSRTQRESPSLARRLAWCVAPLVAVAAIIGAGLLAHGDTRRILLDLAVSGERRELEPALFQAAPLRTANGGRDLVYLVATQSETVYSRSRRPSRSFRRDYLHVDLWAIDARDATVAWRARLRSYQGGERAGRVLTAYVLLGADGTTLWLDVEGPLGVSLDDGRIIADGARIDERNPRLAGKRVNEPGYVAFGRNGLQLTLDDASQWRIDAADLSAAPRDTPVSDPARIVGPALRATTSAFQARALPIGGRWLGVLTDEEADHLRKPPVIPGRDPHERPGVMQRFLEENHVPAPLHEPLPRPYRLWGSRVEQVSAAPPDWPKDWPDNWGTRPRFSAWEVLPESPAFLRAGLLRAHRDSEVPFWYRDPDSVLVLHVDRLGEAGRLQLSRMAGPRGAKVWQASLPFTALASVMHRETDLVLLGHEPATGAARSAADAITHHKLVRLDVASGKLHVLDLTAESLRTNLATVPAQPAAAGP